MLVNRPDDYSLSDIVIANFVACTSRGLSPRKRATYACHLTLKLEEVTSTSITLGRSPPSQEVLGYVAPEVLNQREHGKPVYL